MSTNIKEELYYYAYKEEYTESTQNVKMGRKEFAFTCIFISFLVIIFSLPILFENILFWSFITFICICMFLFNTHEKNAYLKSLLNFVIVLFYFGFIVAQNIDISSLTKFQISRKTELITTPVVGFLIYDIGVIINIVLKKYSTKKNKKISTKTQRSAWDYIGPLLGASIGRSLSRIVGDVPALDWILILICSIVLILSLVFLQKYLICKIFYKKRIKGTI